MSPSARDRAALDLLKRAQSTGDPKLLDDAVVQLDASVTASAPRDPALATRLYALGIALVLRFESRKLPADLDRAVQVGERGLGLTPPGHPGRGPILNNLTYALSKRVDLAAVPQDADRLVGLGEESLALAPPGHPDRALRLSSLAYALSRRFDLTLAQEDIDRAVELYEDAAALTPQGHPDLSVRLSSLGNELRRRSDHTGSAADLDRAIAIGQEAVDLIPPTGAERAGILANLGIALQRRFRATDAPADLDGAIGFKEQALAATPPGTPDRARFLASLSIDLCRRWERSGWLDDVDWAIELGDEAAALTTPDDPDHARIVGSLSEALSSRFQVMGRREDLDRAIELDGRALAAIPPDDPVRAQALCRMSGDLCRRFDRTRAPGDVDRAVELSVETLGLVPLARRDRASALLALGTALAARFGSSGEAGDLERALAVLDEVAGTRMIPAPDRMRAARVGGLLAGEAGRWDEAVERLAQGVGLAAELAPRGLRRAAQEFRLRAVAGLAAEAAAACLQVGTPARAVELLEQGRALLLSQVLDSHPELGDLQEVDPRLASGLAAVLDELNRPIGTDLTDFGLSGTAVRRYSIDPASGRGAKAVARLGPGGPAGQTPSARAEEERRRAAAARFEQLRAEVRSLPGFEQFMRPPGISGLLSAANEGPVVVTNVCGARSDALLITPAGVEAIPLPDLTLDDARERSERFSSGLRAARGRATGSAERDQAESMLADVLGWLWDRVAGPVLDHLGYPTAPTSGRWPRLWWCPTGPLAFLPLHAAGHHGTRFGPTPRTVLDRVVSSTTPSLRALLQSRRPVVAPEGPGSGSRRLLVVAMPETPGHPDLPAAVKEIAILERLYAGRIDVLGSAGAPATRDAVLAALPTHPWAHFSCHAVSDFAEPSASRLLLADHARRPLTVLDVTRSGLVGAQLAVLSACSTARGSDLLPDEPVHLSAAFLAAGYRHVIATLWPIAANDAAGVTRDVYRQLAEGGAADAGSSALALHTAIIGLRAQYPSQPSRWAAYTHSGA